MGKLLERLDGNILPKATLHSDQGMHYPHPGFRLLVAKAGFQQSMSERKTVGIMLQWRPFGAI